MTEKTIYERKAVRFRENWDVLPAISYSESGQIKGKVAEWRDTKTVGLTLRITPGKVVWYMQSYPIEAGKLAETWLTRSDQGLHPHVPNVSASAHRITVDSTNSKIRPPCDEPWQSLSTTALRTFASGSRMTENGEGRVS
jgi:hypothetical protein